MALKIRLRRMGRKKAPHYRIVVAESSMPRDGRFVERLGHYNPRTDPATLVIDADKARVWIGRGAKPTETVHKLFENAGVFAGVKGIIGAATATVKDAVTETGGKARKAAAGAAGKARDAASDAAESAGKTAKAAAEKVAKAADAVVDAAEDAAEAMAEKVEDAVGKVTGEK